MMKILESYCDKLQFACNVEAIQATCRKKSNKMSNYTT